MIRNGSDWFEMVRNGSELFETVRIDIFNVFDQRYGKEGAKLRATAMRRRKTCLCQSFIEYFEYSFNYSLKNTSRNILADIFARRIDNNKLYVHNFVKQNSIIVRFPAS